MSVESELEDALDYEWSSLKGESYPPQYPEWVERLRNRIALWLDGESGFEYLQLAGGDGAAESAPELRVFGLTRRFALLVIITKPQTDSESDVAIDWHLVPRAAITDLDISPKSVPDKEWLVITVRYKGWPESFTFPQDDDWKMDREARKAMFVNLRDDLFPYED